MADTAHFGEFEDGKLYSHIRVAAICGFEKDWALTNIFFPPHKPGVRKFKVGRLWMTTGEWIRLWGEEQGDVDPVPTPEDDN